MIKLIILLLVIALLNFHQEIIYGQCYMSISSSTRFQDTKSNHSLVRLQKYIANRTAGRVQQIPKIIYQTNERDEIPWKMKYAISSFIEKNPEYSYRFFNNTQRRWFIEQNMGKIVLDCYDKLNSNPYRADLFRFSVVYVYGGCYFDIPYVAIDSLNSAFSPQTTFFSTVDDEPSHFKINGAVFCSVAGHKILQQTLKQIVKGISSQSYGNGPLDITGPQKIGQGFKTYQGIQQINYGFYNDKKTFIAKRGFISACLLASMLKTDGSSLIFSRYPDYKWDMQHYIDSPDYASVYRKHQVYNKSIKIQLPQNYQIPKFNELKTDRKNFRIPFQHQ